MAHIVVRWLLLINLFIWCFFPHPALADSFGVPRCLVLKPEMTGSYHQLVEVLVSDFVERFPGSVDVLLLTDHNKGFVFDKINSKRRYECILALGVSANQMLAGRNVDAAIISGLITDRTLAAGTAGITVLPSGLDVVSAIRRVSPNVNKIMVVVDEEEESVFVLDAKREANKHQIGFQEIKASTPEQVISAYRDIVLAADSDTAVWIHPSQTENIRESVQSMLLDASWDKGFALVGSSPGQVAKGMLLSVVCDFSSMGAELAVLASKAVKGQAGRDIGNASDTIVLLNERTFSHLGLRKSDVFLGKSNVRFYR